MGGAGRRAHDGRLADGGVDDPAITKPVHQAFGDLERTAVGPDVLTDAEDVLVPLHLLQQALPYGLEESGPRSRRSLSCHRRFPSPVRARSAQPRWSRPAGTRDRMPRADRHTHPAAHPAAPARATARPLRWRRPLPGGPGRRCRRSRSPESRNPAGARGNNGREGHSRTPSARFHHRGRRTGCHARRGPSSDR